jgi:cellulose synthase/poly-beta-1,6-N-acetylglucosamine synthase-like glycosyltransferase
VLGVKGKNCGKLDSHWWYYRAFCPAIEPAYCFQMDVGTIPSGHALSELLNAFDQSPRIGAVASSIVPNRPASAWDALQCWQYMSFANSVLLEWPAESTVGFLSVVPGQLSAFRWDAISESPDAGTPATEQSRLDVYFKGLGSLTPQESMLYAAEDRVLCRELVFNAQSEWTIAHVDGAVAITDACQSWGELLRQRKRWCNGYLACRTIYLKKLPEFIGTRGVSLRRKLQASAAGMYHSLVMLADWFALAISILVILSATQQAQLLTDPSSPLRPVIAGSMYAAFGAMAVQFLFCWRGRISAPSIAVFATSLAVQAAVIGGAMLVLLLAPGHFLLKGLVTIQFLAAPVASLFGHRPLTSAVARSAPANFLALYVIPLALWMFAVSNSHNNSWGTKGLVSSPIHGAVAGNTGQKQMYLTFRKHYVLAWLASNALAVYQCIQWWGSNSYDLLIRVVGISCLFLVFGLACRIFKRLSRSLDKAR